MKVVVRVDGMKLSVPCGDGGQTMKWLALVASQRYSLAVAGKGHGRARSDRDDKNGFFLPKDVLGQDGSLMPDALIKDVLRDGEECVVELQKVVEVDQVGAPVQSNWQMAAFSTSSETSSRRARGTASREEISEKEGHIRDEVSRRQRDALRHRKAREVNAAADFSLREGDVAHQVVVAGRFEDAEDAAAALDLDWAKISQSLEALDCLPTGTADASFRAFLRMHYDDVNALFIRYAGVARPGVPHGISPLEFGHVVHLARLARYQNKTNESADDADRKRIEFAFTTSSAQRMEVVARALKAHGKEVKIPKLLSRAEFVAALIYLARKATHGATLLDEADEPGHKFGGGRSQRILVSRGGGSRGPETAMDALESLVTNHLNPLEGLRREEAALIGALGNRRVSAGVEQSRAHLLRVFAHYAKKGALMREADERKYDPRGLSKSSAQPREAAITLAAFKDVLKDAGLMALLFTEDHANERLDKVAISAFLASQNDPPFNLELDELVFVEFVEAYSRVANDMLESNDTHSKILLGIEQLCELSLNF
ncbi:hypothetical protein M885DRAFT_621865 [Pelagophyceae sp. CCMP2097]|nr:hypothetical protein M885DRAFT_621865 [Pelagophyceae sp. CCMP2097]